MTSRLRAIRIPEDLDDLIERARQISGRGITAEIVSRLRASFANGLARTAEPEPLKPPSTT